MRTLVSILLLFLNLYSFAGKPDSNKILAEGKLLYRLEKGSWYGTDNFLKNLPHKQEKIGGYLSYEDEEGYINTIFYKRDSINEILARYKFDKTPQQRPLSVDTINTEATKIEQELITLRQDASKRIYSGEDDFFKFYENTSLNLIPIITNKERKVYVLTGPRYNGYVLIGNDYLLTYDKKNKFKKRERIHNSLIQLPYKAENDDNPMVVTVHSHVISDVIDPTDICTLLLYRDFVEWKQHYVFSKKYVSIFDLDKEELIIMTTKAWDKISEHQKSKKEEEEKEE